MLCRFCGLCCTSMLLQQQTQLCADCRSYETLNRAFRLMMQQPTPQLLSLGKSRCAAAPLALGHACNLAAMAAAVPCMQLYASSYGCNVRT
jgi:hypothetical protein